jgi:ABC-type sulfate transport system permease component
MRYRPLTFHSILNRQVHRVDHCQNSHRQVWGLWLAGGLVAIIVLLPILYLLVRVAETGQNTWKLIFQSATLITLGRSLGLALAVSSASA